MKTIDEKTSVSLIFLGAVIGAAGWLTMVYAKGEFLDTRVTKVESKIENMDAKLDAILQAVKK